MTPYALYLLRHGDPAKPGLMLGRTDSEPTAAGIASCVARAAGLGIEALVTSDLRRASQACKAIAEASDLGFLFDPRWRELDFGDWDGKAAAEIEPAALERFWDDPETQLPRGGERWSALVSRVNSALTDLRPVTTLVVTHGGAMRAAMHLLCGFEQRQLWSFDLPYASLVSLRVWPGDKPTAQMVGLCS